MARMICSDCFETVDGDHFAMQDHATSHLDHKARLSFGYYTTTPSHIITFTPVKVKKFKSFLARIVK